MKALVTGGAGFIGSAVSFELAKAGWHVDVFDALTYAAAPGTVAALEAEPRCNLIEGDIRDRTALRQTMNACAPDIVFHLAAETHVDRSIDAAEDFVRTNLTGTFEVLEAVRTLHQPGARGPVLIHVSTDEVFGSLGPDDAAFTETTRYDPSSPYSASKAGSDHLARAWARTYDLDVRISNCSNNYGPRQFPEKLIPLMTLNALDGAALPVYGDGSNRRDWLHVEDHARALRLIAEHGEAGETYCIGGGAERSNLSVVQTICDHLDTIDPQPQSRRDQIKFVTDRPGHDWRYAINADKADAKLGWRPSHDFDTGLKATIDWYRQNSNWWRPLRERYSGVRLGEG
jgi:dTDP-glucose 4,6-dehydratase